MPMSFFPAGPEMPQLPLVAASPSTAVDLVQAPVMLYLWVLPFALLAYLVLAILALVSLPFPARRQRMRAMLGNLSAARIAAWVQTREPWLLRRNWSSFLYIVLLGSPLVAIIAVVYGHHFLSLSAYDSPFQAYAQLYGFLLLVIPVLVLSSLAGFPYGTIVVAVPVIAFVASFFALLLWVYGVVLARGIHPALRRHMLSLACFAAAQPFIFRLLRFTVLPWMGVPGAVPPVFGWNATYAVAFFLPCVAYALGGMLAHWYAEKTLRRWFFGLHAALLFLAVLAADLH